MAIEIRERELKNLYVTMREFEQEYGKTVNDILLEIIYDCYKENPQVALEGIKIVFFSKKDVVRHGLVQKIIKAYEDLDAQKKK